MDSNKPSEESFLTLGTNLHKILANGRFSDMKIKCGDTVYNTHRAIVCTQSSFFANVFKEEYNFKESQTNTIELHDDPEIVQAAIKFMYNKVHIDDIIQNYKYDAEKVNFHLHVYIFAEKYGIGGLREKSANIIDLMFIDDRKFDPEEFLHTVSTAYECVPESDKVLLPTLVRIAVRRLGKLRDNAAFQETIQNASGFGAAVLMELVRLDAIHQGNSDGVHSYLCFECSGTFLMKLNNGRRTFCPGCGYHCENSNWELKRQSRRDR